MFAAALPATAKKLQTIQTSIERHMEKKMAERHIAEYDTAIGHGIQECHKYHVEQ